MKHNICCIIADSLRWDVFCEANPRNILSMGEVQKAYAPGCSTLPSMMAFLMNYPPIGIGLGLFDQGTWVDVPVKAGDTIVRTYKEHRAIRRWMPKYYQEQGYVTVYLSANAVPIRLNGELDGVIRRYFNYWKAEEYDQTIETPRIIKDLEEIVAKEKDNPIFAVILLLDTHSPYHDGEGKTHLVSASQPQVNRHWQTKAMQYLNNVFPNFLNIFSKTERPTEFIFTSDHGEQLGKADGWGHSPFRKNTAFNRGLFEIPFLRRRINDWGKVKITTPGEPREPTQEGLYWDDRYKKGGNSGLGSEGMEREWKWNTILGFNPDPNYIIDVACGDMRFWDSPLALKPKQYIGIDISETIVKRNQERFPEYFFIASPAEVLIEGHKPAPTVLCIDLLFHILEDEAYEQILRNLQAYSDDMIFIHTWMNNPLAPEVTDGVYQKYRDFDDSIQLFREAGFVHIDTVFNPNGIGGLYVFGKGH